MTLNELCAKFEINMVAAYNINQLIKAARAEGIRSVVEDVSVVELRDAVTLLEAERDQLRDNEANWQRQWSLQVEELKDVARERDQLCEQLAESVATAESTVQNNWDLAAKVAELTAAKDFAEDLTRKALFRVGQLEGENGELTAQLATARDAAHAACLDDVWCEAQICGCSTRIEARFKERRDRKEGP